MTAFSNVPYFNSSLFEITDLEGQVIHVNSLKDQFELPLAPYSLLRGGPDTRKPLHYLFAFLDAYDFGGEGEANIQEDNKQLINASVLGLIFEKINGYRDGSFYTPGFITEFMCRETIRRAAVQKLSSDAEALWRIELCRAEGHPKLNISGLKLKAIPLDIKQLKQLVTLDLEINQISEVGM